LIFLFFCFSGYFWGVFWLSFLAFTHSLNKGEILIKEIIDYRCRVTDLPIQQAKDGAVLVQIFKPELEKLIDEKLVVISLDSNDNVLGYITFLGYKNTASCDIGHIVRACSVTRGSQVALIHNHPTGSHALSQEDVAEAKIIAKYLNAIGIKLHSFSVTSSDCSESIQFEQSIIKDLTEWKHEE
jgi:hypothetical protein